MEFARLLQQLGNATTAGDHSNRPTSAADRPHPNTVKVSNNWDLLKYLADICHLLSFFILIYNMKKKKNCLGVSYRTMEIYLIVFLTRYSDIFFVPQLSKWNTTLKVLFISMTLYCIYLIRYERPICVSYESIMDKFPHRITVLPIALVVGFLLPDYSIWAMFHPLFHRVYNFTLALESMAILPQLALIRKIREIEIVTGGYIFCLGMYRGIYILSWIWRMVEMKEYFSGAYIKFIFGIIQFILYGDFFINYIKSVQAKKPYVTLPI